MLRTALAFLALIFGMLNPQGLHAQQSDAKFAIVIHGGAGGSPSVFNDQYNATRQLALEKALEIGTEVLSSGGSSLDAVEKVISFLEDDPHFNAGRGAVFTDQGKIELDASIMVGDQKRCGAAASVTTVRHPIQLARKVMEETRHVLLVREGAEQFAQNQQLEIVDNDFFWTEKRKQQWKRRQTKSPKSSVSATDKIDDPFDSATTTASYRGTVGCVALDQAGNICAGTSTGGMQGKKFGRVGDSPIIGAGTYADNRFAGVSATGTGEQYIRNAACYQVIARMRFADQNLEQAIDAVLNQELNQGDGGLIGLDSDGHVVAKWNTDAMAFAYRDADGNQKVVWDPKAEAKPAPK